MLEIYFLAFFLSHKIKAYILAFNELYSLVISKDL